MLIRNALLPAIGRRDVHIQDGKIAAIGDALPADDLQIIDATGKVLFPGFVDAHSHLDKSLLGRPWFGYHPRSLQQMLADERTLRSAPDWDNEQQIGNNVEVMVRNGATHTRAFVDIDTEVNLSGLHGMLAAQKKYRHAITMHIIAFAQSGIAGRPGTTELLERALENGADSIGGMDPCSVERNPVQHLDLIFALAEKHGTGIDIHLHERGELGAFSAGLIVERAKALQLPRPVVISHPDFLGDIPLDRARRIVEEMVDAGVAVTTCVPSGDPKPPLRIMRDAGLSIGVGCDGQRDSWGPLNRSDMLFKAYLLAWRYGFGTQDDVEIAGSLITYGGAGVMNLSDYGLRTGAAADLVLLPGEIAAEPLIELPYQRTVIKAGRIVADAGELIHVD